MTDSIDSLHLRPALSPRARPLVDVATLALVAAIAVSVIAGYAIVTRSPALLAIAAAGIGLALAPMLSTVGFRALLLWPIASVLAYPFARIPQQEAVITLDRVWLLALIPAIVIGGRAIVSRTSLSRWMTAALILYAAAFGVRALFTSENQLYALETWLDAGALPVILFLFARQVTRTPEQALALIKALAVAGGIAGLIAVLQRILGFDLAVRAGGAVFTDVQLSNIRYSGPFPHPEMLAVCLLVSLACTLCWAQTRPRWFSGPILPLLAVQLAGVFLTYFRAAYIALVLVLIVAIGLRPRRFSRLFSAALVVCSLAGAITWQLAQDDSLSTRLTETQNVSGRLATYIQGMSLFTADPLTGVGVAQFGSAQQAIQPVAVNGIFAVPSPHNNYIGVLAEQGLLGGVPYIAATLVGFLLLRRLVRVARGPAEAAVAAALAAAALGYLFVSLTLGIYVEFAPGAFVGVILGVACAQLDRIDAPATRPGDQRAGA